MNKLKALKRVLKFFYTELPKDSIISALYYLLSSFSTTISTLILQTIFDCAYSIINKEMTSIQTFWRYGLLFIFFHLIIKIIQSISSVSINAGIYERCSYLLRLKITQKSSTLPLFEYESDRVMDIKQKAEVCVEDEHLPGIYMLSLVLVLSLGGIISLIIVVGRYHWSLALIAILSVAQFLISSLVLEKQKYKITEEQTKSNRMLKYVWSLFSTPTCEKEMRTMGFDNYLSEKWRKIRRENINTFQKQLKHDSIIILFCDIIRVLGYTFGILTAILYLINGRISVGIFGACIYAFIDVQTIVKDFFSALGTLPTKLQYAIDYWNYLDIPVDSESNIKFLGLKKSICVSNLEFNYPNKLYPTINNVSFEIKAGETIVILGENGSGKTTLIKLLLGLYNPLKGNIMYDGQSITEIDKTSFYSHVTIVMQDFNLYAIPLRENIALQNLNAANDNQRLLAAAREAHLDANIENDFDKIIGRDFDGIEPSIGQKQKIAVSRAIFEINDIVILDEPTSAIDPVTESQILGNFVKLLKNRTTIIVSHRVGLCKLANKIIVMKNGKICEMGDHKELLDRQGEYSKMYNAQKRWYQ